jgi:branched-chain amino acid transport system substrate-binding protein
MFGYAAGEALVNALKTATVPRPDPINAAWNATMGLVVTGLPPGATLDAVGNTGRLVHTFQLVRFDGKGWQPVQPPVDAMAAGYTGQR